VLALLTACGADTDVTTIDSSVQNNETLGNAGVTKMDAASAWSIVTTTGAGDGYVLFGNETYQWLDGTCIDDLRGASIPVTPTDWNTISAQTQIAGVGDCAVVKAHFSDVDGGGGWRVVTTTANGDGYVLFNNGTRQWLDAACIQRVRASGTDVPVVPWNEISDLSQEPGLGDCDAVIANAGGNSGSDGDEKWQIVTTTTDGDGYVIYENNTRQWLSVSCISRLRRDQAFVRTVTWQDIADITQIAGVGDCDAIARNAEIGQTPADRSCNKLTSAGFEASLGDWQSDGTVSLVEDPHNGNQAATVSNGSLSYEIPVSEVGTEITFFGFYKNNGRDMPAYAGIDFLRDGQKIGGDVTTLTPFWEEPSAYSLFMRNATVPATATSIRVWIYTEHTVTVDDLELRNADCSNGPPVAGTYLTAPVAACTLSTYQEINGFSVKISEEPVAGTARIDLDVERGNLFADGVQMTQNDKLTPSAIFTLRGSLFDVNGPTKAAIDEAPGGVRGGVLYGYYLHVFGKVDELTDLGFTRTKGNHLDEAGREVQTVLDCTGEIR